MKTFALSLLLLLLPVIIPAIGEAQSMSEYLNESTAYPCTVNGTKEIPEGIFHSIDFTSLEWRGAEWHHSLEVLIPRKVKVSSMVYLLIYGSGDGNSEREELKEIVRATGMPAAMIGDIPNQPLYDGKKEDELLAYTLKQFMESGDHSWPILLPMTKAVTRAMTCLSAAIGGLTQEAPQKFMITGASKRGWTTWLAGLNDPRVIGIAPRVFDMLNMKAQIAWAKKTYGGPSEQIQNYTALGLTDRLDEPRAQELLGLVDPYSYLGEKNPSTLVVIGANDPYWVIDASSHYWKKVPAPRGMVVVPNGTHSVAHEAIVKSSLLSWAQRLIDGTPLPEVRIIDRMTREGKLCVGLSEKARTVKLWYAKAATHDFRKSIWFARDMESQKDTWCGTLPASCKGAYCSYFVSAGFQGGNLVISTPPLVQEPSKSF